MDRLAKTFGLAHLFVVRRMTRHRILALVCCIVTGVAPAAATAAETFKTAAADAARHFGTPEGHAYAMMFVRDVLKAAYDASQACKQSPRDAMHDIVFIVSSKGRIERTIAGGKTTFGRCLSDSMHLPQRVSPPPGGHWAVQLRFFNGPRKVEGADPPFIVLFLPGQ
jgi:hypothetical protein